MTEIPTREEIIERRNNYFNLEQLHKIDNTVVCIAGCGTLGGYLALQFARIGVRAIRLLEPDIFESANIAKQFGASIKSVGKNKAKVVAEEIKNINPYVDVKVFNTKFEDVKLDAFFEEASLVVDAIEYFTTEAVALFYKEVEKRAIWCFTGQAAGPYISTIGYKPGTKYTWQNLFQDKQGQIDILKMTKKLFPQLSKISQEEFIYFVKNPSKIPTAPSIPLIGPGIVFQNIVVHYYLGNGSHGLSPSLISFDVEKNKFEIVDIDHE